MAQLSISERMKIEKLMGMGSGYILEFSNRTFQEFMAESVGVDIYSGCYNHGSGSKANRLRGFVQRESNYLVGKALADLLEHWRSGHLMRGTEISQADKALYDDCQKVIERLKAEVPVQDVEALDQQTGDKDFNLLSQSLRESIKKNEPEVALDRLHTFVVKYVRRLCQEEGIAFDREKPLHGLFGEYVKHLKQGGRIHSEMTERILKSAISILDSFNSVRNNQSFAHDNPILNYSESLLIFNNVCSSIRFLESLKRVDDSGTPRKEEDEFDLPF